jgi:hypothetical protein
MLKFRDRIKLRKIATPMGILVLGIVLLALLPSRWTDLAELALTGVTSLSAGSHHVLRVRRKRQKKSLGGKD